MFCKYLSILLLAIATAGIFTGCDSGSEAEMLDLLEAVPADAGAVAAVNLERILTDAGSKVKDGIIEPDAAMTSAIENVGRYTNDLRCILEPDNGVDADVLVIFWRGGYTFIAGNLRNPEQFKQFWGTQGAVFTAADDGIQTADRIAIRNNRFWICNNRPGDGTMASIARTTKENSMAATPFAKRLSEANHDAIFTTDLSLLAESLPSSMQARLLFSMLFKDAAKADGFCDFKKKGRWELEMTIVTPDHKEAQFLLPTESIDPQDIKNMDCSADVIAAAAVPHKMVEKIFKMANVFGGTLPEGFADALKPIDGTIVVAASPADDIIAGSINTSQQPLSALTDALGTLGYQSRIDGRRILFNNGSIVGKLPLQHYADDFKGAIAGIIVNTSNTMANDNVAQPITNGSDRFMAFILPQGNGLKLKAIILFDGSDLNAFINKLNTFKKTNYNSL